MKGIHFIKKIEPTPNFVYPKAEIKTKDQISVYHLPYELSPIMLKDKKLIVGMEANDTFYHLAIATSGAFTVSDVSPKTLSQATLKIEGHKCEELMTPNDFFVNTVCKRIWDQDSDEMVSIRLQWSCP